MTKWRTSDVRDAARCVRIQAQAQTQCDIDVELLVVVYTDANYQSAANDAALRACGASDCVVQWTGQINDDEFGSSNSFQAVALTMDDLWSSNGNIATDSPSTGSDPSAIFDAATHACRLKTGDPCYVANYVTRPAHSYDCVTAAVCQSEDQKWHRQMWYGASIQDAKSGGLRQCAQHYGSTCMGDNCETAITTCA